MRALILPQLGQRFMQLIFAHCQKDEIVDVKTGEKKPTGIPKSNVLYFELTEDAWLCVRPSGTEPKIKLYFGVVGKDLADADEKSEKLAVIVKDLLNQLG